MLEIVLLILKIAGIILAAVLGILIVAVCCVLFVPVRYRGDFAVSDKEGGDGKNIAAVFRAFWLLRLVRVYVSYEESLRVRVKLFLFTVFDTAKEARTKKKKKAEKNKKADGEQNQECRKEDTGNEKGVTEEDDGGEKGQEREPEADGEADEGGDVSPSKEKKGIRGRISNILQTIRNFCDKLKGMGEKAKKAQQLWISEHMISSRSLLGRQLIYLLRHSKPRRLDGYIQFGFDDPAITGYAMAAYGILCQIWSPKLSVQPDFERQVLDMHIRIRGRVRVCHFLRAALSLYFSKDVRRVLKDLKDL